MIRISYNFDYVEKLIIALMVIITLAFHDKTSAMVISQIVALAVELLACKCRIGMTRELCKYILWETLFVSLSLCSFLWAQHTNTLLNVTIGVCQVTMTGIVLTMFCREDADWEFLVDMIILAAGILILRLLITVPYSAWGDERIGKYLGEGTSGGYGNTGVTYVLSTGAIFALYKGILEKKKSFCILFAVFTVFSALSGSKKALVIFVITIFFAAVLSSKDPIKAIRNLCIAGVAILIGGYLIMNNEVLYGAVGVRLEYFLNFMGGSAETDASTQSRADYLVQAFEMFKDNPVLGVGLDGFRYFNSAHCWAENNLLEIMADLGIIGVIVYYWFPLSIFSDALKKTLKNSSKAGMLITAVICLLFIDSTMVTYANDSLQFFWVIVFLGLRYGSNLTDSTCTKE